MQAATLSALAVVLCAPVAFGQMVQFRLVERTGQSQASPADNVLDLAVQAKVTGSNLGAFSFDMRIAGEAEGRGALERDSISNLDGTYDTSIGVNSSVGRGGIARQYSYLAGVNSSFNGLINTSGGTFTNGPDQEIGLVAGFAQSTPLVSTPGIDTDGDGNPDTWSGNGSGLTPPGGATAALSPSVAGPYFASGQYIDVYRFRYTVTDLTMRTLHFTLAVSAAQDFTQFVFGPSNQWAAQNSPIALTNISSTPLDISVIPVPSTAVMLALAGLGAGKRRRTRSV